MSKSGQTAQKRLLQELKSLQDEPNPALELLSPVGDDDLFEWKAVMKGVPGTAYEGMPALTAHRDCYAHSDIQSLTKRM